MTEITIALDVDDARYTVIALREQTRKMRKIANGTNLMVALGKAAERIDKVADRIERELYR